jgi:hypothetical protein
LVAGEPTKAAAVLGVVVAPGLAHDVTSQVADELVEDLRERYAAIDWRTELLVDRLVVPPAPTTEIDAARRLLDAPQARRQARRVQEPEEEGQAQIGASDDDRASASAGARSLAHRKARIRVAREYEWEYGLVSASRISRPFVAALPRGRCRHFQFRAVSRGGSWRTSNPLAAEAPIYHTCYPN